MAFSRPTELFAQLDVIPLPPEEQWVPARRTGPRGASLLAIVATIAIVVVAAAIVLSAVAQRFDRGLVPAAPPSHTVALAPTPVPNASGNLPPGLATNGTHRVSGLVYETVAGVRRPMPNVPVNVWVDVGSGGGYSLWFKLGHPIQTDASGRFELTDLGDSTMVFWAAAPGHLQPQPAILKLRTDGTIDIGLVREPDAAAGRVPDLLPGSSDLSRGSLFGVVFETVGGVRRPVAGARVSVEWSMDVVMAETITDNDGRYAITALPVRSIGVYAARSGYALTYVTVDVNGDMLVHNGDTPLDIELKPGP